MNGSVVPLIEKVKHDSIAKKVKEWVKVFYVGDELTDFEREVERQYLFAKNQKVEKFKKRKSTRYKVRWTMSDLNRYQEQKNYRMNDPEYFANPKPQFEPYNLDKALESLSLNQDIVKMGKLRRLYAWFADVKVFERGKTRSQLVATQLITRFLLYQDSHEFVNALDLQDDFHIHNSVANMHLWLLF